MTVVAQRIFNSHFSHQKVTTDFFVDCLVKMLSLIGMGHTSTLTLWLRKLVFCFSLRRRRYVSRRHPPQRNNVVANFLWFLKFLLLHQSCKYPVYIHCSFMIHIIIYFCTAYPCHFHSVSWVWLSTENKGHSISVFFACANISLACPTICEKGMSSNIWSPWNIYSVSPHPYNNLYKFHATCITMYRKYDYNTVTGPNP